MKKRFLTLLLSATMLFSIVGFTACTNSDLEAKIAELQAQIATQQEQIADLQEQNANLQADVTEQQTQISTQQTQIAELEQENEDLQVSVSDQQEQIEALDQENQELQTTITNQQEQIEALEQKLEDQIALPFIKEIEADGMIELRAWGELFGHNIIVTNFEEENVIFECKAKNGFIFSGDNIFYWSVQSPGMSHWGGLTYYQDYISVVAKTENNILGYGVIEVLLSEDSATATVIKSVKFPMVDGEYQHITQSQVDMLIENVVRG